MTLLGKVLVFVNLFFSLAVAFFITQSYAKRTDWNRAYNDAKKALTTAESQRDQYQKEAQDAINQGNAKVAAIQLNFDKALKEKTDCQAVVTDLRNQAAKKD